ncbi:FHA domain-containing protein, partial [Haematococcus lacustris]
MPSGWARGTSRQKEHKVKNMQTENDRISAKEKQEGGLTPGQAAALVRNEQGMNKLRDEMEELEELLLDSIKDAIADRSKEAAKKVSGKKKRATTASDEEYLGSDSDDEFYDRTAAHDDSLDAFMTTMKLQLESDKVQALRRELQEVESEQARVARLLQVVDADGFYKPGTKAAALAKAAAQRTLEQERKKREAAAAAAAKRKAE